MNWTSRTNNLHHMNNGSIAWEFLWGRRKAFWHLNWKGKQNQWAQVKHGMNSILNFWSLHWFPTGSIIYDRIASSWAHTFVYSRYSIHDDRVHLPRMCFRPSFACRRACRMTGKVIPATWHHTFMEYDYRHAFWMIYKHQIWGEDISDPLQMNFKI